MSILRWLSLIVGVGALWFSHGLMRAPRVANDGTQYLDAAGHLLSGECFCASVAHFDEQVNVGHLPVSFTHFAPGYPILVAGIAASGIEPETAGYLISALAFLLTVSAMWDIGTRFGVGHFSLLSISLLWLSNAMALGFAAAIGADSAMAAVFCVTVALVVRDIQTDGAGQVYPFAIGVAGAASYWTKYAGLFVLVTVVLYLAWRAWRWPAARLRAAGGIGIALVLALPIPLHNILYQGSWKGGFESGKHHSVAFALKETIKAIFHLLFGGNSPARLDVWALIAILSFIAAILLLIRNRQVPTGRVELAWIAGFAVALTGGIAVVAMQSIATDMARYNLPVYPLLLIIAAVLLNPKTRMEGAVTAILVVAILVIQSRSVIPLPASPVETMRVLLTQQNATGVPIRQWLESHIQPAEVIIAADGQALHYVLKRSVVAPIVPENTDRPYDENAFRSTMVKFRARFMVVYPDRPEESVPEQEAIPFLKGLASGRVPDWLTLVTRTHNIAVFECASCQL